MNDTYFFCPNPGCSAHRLDLDDEHWYYRYGFHATRAFGRVQRYRCRRCGKTFSDQTFLLNYWLKKPTDFADLGAQINSSSSSLFVARNNDYSSDSIRIRQDRLGRNGLALQATLTKQLLINESLVADGLESFVSSQFFPINLNVLIGKRSKFLYYFTESHSRRKGTTTAKQKHLSTQLYVDKLFQYSTLSIMFTKLLAYLHNRCPHGTLRLDTDKNPIYRSVISRWNEKASAAEITLDHRTTPSTAPRTQANDLFAVNYFDRLIRKDLPNHRRETICYARNDRNMLVRFAYYMVCHNFYKPFRITSKAKQRAGTHAERVIVRDEVFKLWSSRMHTHRFFRSLVPLPDYFDAVWCKRTPTPLKRYADPVPKFAFQ